MSCHGALSVCLVGVSIDCLEAKKRDKLTCDMALLHRNTFEMPGTIRRPVQDTPDSSSSGAPPPPSYQAAISPTAARVPPSSSSSSSGNINAGAFQQRQPSSGSLNNSRHSVAVTGITEHGRPLPQAPSQPRPQSYAYAQPSGAPPPSTVPQQQQQFRQPPGPPPQRAYSNASSHHPATAPGPSSGAGLQRSNTQEDRLAVCRYHA